MRTIFLFLIIFIAYLVYITNNNVINKFTVSNQACDNGISIGPSTNGNPLCLEDVSNCECPPGTKFYGNKCRNCDDFACSLRDATNKCCEVDDECNVSGTKCIVNHLLCKNIPSPHPQCPSGEEWKDNKEWYDLPAGTSSPTGNAKIDFCCETKPLPPYNPCTGDIDCNHGTCEIDASGVPYCKCDDDWTGYDCNASCNTSSCLENTSASCCKNEACTWDGTNCKNIPCKKIVDETNCSGLTKDCCYQNWDKCSYDMEKKLFGPKKNCSSCIGKTANHTKEKSCGENGYCLQDGKCACNDGYGGECCMKDCTNTPKCEDREARKECCNVDNKCKLKDGVCQYYIKAGTGLINPTNSPNNSQPIYCTNDSDCSSISSTCDLSTNYCIPTCKSDIDIKCIYPKDDKYYKTMDEITQELFGKDSKTTDLKNMYCAHNLLDSSPYICPYGPTECTDESSCNRSRLCNPLDSECKSINNEDVNTLNTTSCNNNRCEWIGYSNNVVTSPTNNICEINYDVDKNPGDISWCCNEGVNKCDIALKNSGCKRTGNPSCTHCINTNVNDLLDAGCSGQGADNVFQNFCKPPKCNPVCQKGTTCAYSDPTDINSNTYCSVPCNPNASPKETCPGPDKSPCPPSGICPPPK